MWLSYSDDEVRVFHPAFQAIADDLLVTMGIATQYRWEHHPASVGVPLTPDFVLVDIASNNWRLVVEIKRTRAAVNSERNQVQAKAYAEFNQLRYGEGWARYFCITNMETTLLFALNGGRPPRDCRVHGMEFDSDSFGAGTGANPQAQFTLDLRAILEHVQSTRTPTFEAVWPGIVRLMLSYLVTIPWLPIMDLNVNGIPQVVADYFVGNQSEAARRELLLRCLSVEYFRGILARVEHPQSSRTAPIPSSLNQVANAIADLHRIDFAGIFENTAPRLYRTLSADRNVALTVESYLSHVGAANVRRFARERVDALEFPDVLISEIYPMQVQNARGKVQTDPDLAALLVALTIDGPDTTVLDPGCGDGSLLTAAYDTLRVYGLSHAAILSKLKGIDADALAVKVAAMRLVLKNPFALSVTDPSHITPGDMFFSRHVFNDVDVVLMNPPFKRYEAQDNAPIPAALREHFKTGILNLGDSLETDVGQANIYNLYVEFVIKASSESTVFGIILDNRWYHNRNSKALRALLLRECAILAIVEYPHDTYFAGWTIATSILVARKGTPAPAHGVQFLRTNNPTLADFTVVGNALRGAGTYPHDWTANCVDQSTLTCEISWKAHFSGRLRQEYRDEDWPNLEDLFTNRRRGSLAKEGGGIAVYEFPFDRTNYGPRRLATGNGGRFRTREGEDLSIAEQAELRAAAARIPDLFRGYAIQNADQLTAYTLTTEDVTQDQTLEAPAQRVNDVQVSYRQGTRRRWDGILDNAVLQLRGDPQVGDYINLIERVVGLTETILPPEQVWNVLREPYAGELIIPRKLRVAHRIHINPFAYTPNERQVRLSSNFLTYGDCNAVDVATGLDRETAVELIAAFFMSSFGWLQCEIEAVNREGVRSLEQCQVRKIKIFDPRWVCPTNRPAIIAAARALPYPLRTDRSPHTQNELRVLDELFANEVVQRNGTLNRSAMLNEVWQALTEWLEARNP